MLIVKNNDAETSYNMLADAMKAAGKSGAELCFWQKTLKACEKDESAWNDFINGLWQSGGADEAVRLHGLFKEQKTRRWFLMALVLMEPEDKKLWQVIVNARDGEPEGLVAWLEDYKNKGIRSTSAAFKEDAALWQSITTARTGNFDLFKSWVESHRSTRCKEEQDVFDKEIAYWQSQIEEPQATEGTQDSQNAIMKQRKKIARRSESRPGTEMAIVLPGGVVMVFCWCPATTSEDWKAISGGNDFFMMGSRSDEVGHNPDEDRHPVKLEKGFWVGKYPVTVRQWNSVMDKRGEFTGGSLPMRNITWDECQQFIEKVNAEGTVKVALPTEEEWEYACRAGTETPYAIGDNLSRDSNACISITRAQRGSSYGTEVENKPFTVGHYIGNAWGLHDMHGNVWEWCQDEYREDYLKKPKVNKNPVDAAESAVPSHVMRGGSGRCTSEECRSARRSKSNGKADDIGFRLVCLEEPQG